MDYSTATAALNGLEWAIVVALGLAFGSFATVLESRIPAGKSVVSPASACPRCGHKIRWFENFPVISYLLLGGRCASCKTKISPRYPLIELSTAALFVLAFMPGAAPQLTPGHTAMAVMAAITIPLTLIDLREHRLPNAMTYPAALILLGIMLVAPFTGSSWGESGGVFLQGLVPAVGLLALGLLSRGGMGLGDVKLAAVMGWAIGWFGLSATFTAFVVAFLLGGLFAIAALIAKKAGRKTAIPFGPFLLFGLWISFALGNSIQNVVLSLWGL